MNIFILDNDPVLSVQYLTDSDLNLMIDELYRVLSTVVKLKKQGPVFHTMDGWTKWAATGQENFDYLMQLCVLANMELNHRFNKTNDNAIAAIMLPNPNLPVWGDLHTWTPHSIEQCRLFYKQTGTIMAWTNRNIPEWMCA